MKTKILLPIVLLTLSFSASAQSSQKTRQTKSYTAKDIKALPNNVLYVLNDSITGTSKNIFKKIKPSEIASLKKLDAPAETAIYGTRGANGVVLVTTHKGKNKSAL
jgi:TonB-dependent SusC/RagA subfamily outer membrane receptor